MGDAETIPATGKHNYTVLKVVTEATCDSEGVQSVKCSVCNHEDANAKIPELGHDFSDWKVLIEPTCTDKGEQSKYCKRCLIVEKEKTLALGHEWSNYITDSEPTCTEDGSKHIECTVCGEKQTAVKIDKTGHDFSKGNTCAVENCGAKVYDYDFIDEAKSGIVITKFNGDKAENYELYIPAEIDGYPVKAIGARAFMNITEKVVDGKKVVNIADSHLETVFIPDTVTSIGAYAFANTALKAVTLSTAVTEIGECAFGYNISITLKEVKEETTTPDTPETVSDGETNDGTTSTEPKYEEEITTAKVATAARMESLFALLLSAVGAPVSGAPMPFFLVEVTVTESIVCSLSLLSLSLATVVVPAI
jgi:hypothetical protein